MQGIFYIPLYLQVRGDSSTGAGLKMLPSPVGISVGSLVAGYFMKKTGRYVELGIGSLVMMIIGVGMFNTQAEYTPGWVTMIAFFFTGGGYGAMLTTTLLACIAAVDHSQQAVITSATCTLFSPISSKGTGRVLTFTRPCPQPRRYNRHNSWFCHLSEHPQLSPLATVWRRAACW
jgi:Na+/melibiose symporter-like transporter